LSLNVLEVFPQFRFTRIAPSIEGVMAVGRERGEVEGRGEEEVEGGGG